MDNQRTRAARIALLWRGNPEERRTATLEGNRLGRVAAALAAQGLDVEPAVYCEELRDEVRDRLVQLDGVLVWVNPLADGRDRVELDALLRQVASRGVWVSAHPDVILKMGTKEVLQRTRSLGWGSDCHLYRSAAQLRDELPARLAAGSARVLKRNRGNAGQGVWKVELVERDAQRTAPVTMDTLVEVLHAERGSTPQRRRLGDFLQLCDPYFAHGGCVLDQAFQPRLPEGMIRCYMVQDRVAGFGHQLIKALIPPPPEGPISEAAQPGPRIMHGASAPQFQRLRRAMESEWVPAMQQLLGIDQGSLPVIWDADFLYGPKTAGGEDTYVLCEINVSCVFPFPDEALQPLAEAAVRALRRRGERPPPATSV